MPELGLSEFADKVSEIMTVLSKEFFNHHNGEFYKTKVTMPQFVVLEMLNRLGESRMTDLARGIQVTTAAMTGIVDRLVRDGYVVRLHDSEDRRTVKIKLTSKGSKAVKVVAAEKKRVTSKIFAVISQKERENYLKILTHIHDHIVGERH